MSTYGEGRTIISASWDKTLKLWDVKTAKPIRNFKGHTGNIEAVSMSGDGRYAISASWDKTLMLWNVETGEAIHTFTGHTTEICALSVSSDFKRAISASDDKTLILWDLEPFMTPQVSQTVTTGNPQSMPEQVQ